MPPFYLDALDVPGDYDLVYVDTPYIPKSGVGVDYLDFYHFPLTQRQFVTIREIRGKRLLKSSNLQPSTFNLAKNHHIAHH